MTAPTAAPPRPPRSGARRPPETETDTARPPRFHRDRPVFMTKAEWEAFSETAPYPHEWLGRQPVGGTDDEAVGEVRPKWGYFENGEPAMSTQAHAAIAMNLSIELGTRLRDKPFALYSGMLAVRDPIGPYYYPDVLISPYPGEFEPHPNGVELYLIDPLVVIEVLSPSTERVDRGLAPDGGKRAAYLRIDTVTDYLLVAQDRPHVTHLRRDGDRWEESNADGMEAVVTLTAPAATLPLDAVYRRVTLTA